MEVLVFFFVMIGVYFAPGIIAVIRKHNNAAAIFALTLLLGWTLLGWVAALVWAATDNVATTTTSKVCPDCKEDIQPQANVCKHCGLEFDG